VIIIQPLAAPWHEAIASMGVARRRYVATAKNDAVSTTTNEQWKRKRAAYKHLSAEKLNL
jgi:hypothetical protein